MGGSPWQFQISDLMFLMETRLTNEDFYIFKLNPYPLTYHRGMNGIGPAEGIFFDNNTQNWRGEFGSFYPMVMRLTDGRKLYFKGFVV